MTNTTNVIINESVTMASILADYPVKPLFLRYLLIITVLFVGLAFLLLFFSKFNKQTSKRTK